MRLRPGRGLHDDLARELADLAIGAGVHADRTADGGRDPGQPIDADAAQVRDLGAQHRQRSAAAGLRDHGPVVGADVERGELALEAQHDPANPAVADEQIRARTEREHRQPALEHAAQHEGELVAGAHLDQRVGGSADLPPGERRERRVEPRALGEALAQRVAIGVVEQRDRLHRAQPTSAPAATRSPS